LKIFQSYYRDDQKAHLLPNTTHLDTRKIECPRLEYDIFKHLRPEGDFGLISWKFYRKSKLDEWEDQARELLRHYDAVIINPFPAISAVSYNCWQSHPRLIKVAQDMVDTDEFQVDMAFCSYILGKKGWWDRYFEFMEKHLDHPGLNQDAGYSRGNFPMTPFVVERLLNYTLEGAYIWQYPEEHHLKKFGTTEFHELREIKPDFNAWAERAKTYDLVEVCRRDDNG